MIRGSSKLEGIFFNYLFTDRNNHLYFDHTNVMIIIVVIEFFNNQFRGIPNEKNCP